MAESCQLSAISFLFFQRGTTKKGNTRLQTVMEEMEALTVLLDDEGETETPLLE